MAHKEQQEFLLKIKNKFPSRFTGCSVLDIGSLDINGNNRYLFDNYTYIGVDIGEGNNVDVVCNGHEFDSKDQFDIVISTECFEHDYFYKKTINNAIRLTKSGGMFLFTCASTGRPEHGTKNSGSAWASPFTCNKWEGYYKNLTEQDIKDCVDMEKTFTDHYFEYNPHSSDLYFYGIKI